MFVEKSVRVLFFTIPRVLFYFLIDQEVDQRSDQVEDLEQYQIFVHLRRRSVVVQVVLVEDRSMFDDYKQYDVVVCEVRA